MDCSAFHRHHVAYVDDTLPGDLLVAAARHAAECSACARHDTAVRRSLMLARNICGPGRLECSPDFAARLEARLRREDVGGALGSSGLPADDWTPTWRQTVTESLAGRLPASRRTRQALAAAAVVAAASTTALLRGGEPQGQLHGLGGGPLVAAFGSPFTPVPAGDLRAGDDVLLQVGLRSASDVSPPADPSENGADIGRERVYDGAMDAEAMDAGALVAPAAVGVPVWAAAMLAGEVPAALWRADGGSGVELVRMGH